MISLIFAQNMNPQTIKLDMDEICTIYIKFWENNVFI